MLENKNLFIDNIVAQLEKWVNTDPFPSSHELYEFLQPIGETASALELYTFSKKIDDLLYLIEDSQTKIGTREQSYRLLENLITMCQKEQLLATEIVQDPLVVTPTKNTLDEPEGLLMLLCDDMQSLIYTKETLEQKRFMVVITPTLAQAMDIFYDQQQPDGIIIHLNDEKKSLEALVSIRSNTQMTFTPIVMLTSKYNKQFHIHCLEQGVDDIMHYPYELDMLIAKLKRHCQNKETLSRLILFDELTGAYNRKYLPIEFNRQFQNLQRNNTPFSLVMLDIDHFKQVNDTYGHPTGDTVLQAFVELLYQEKRENDCIIRYGGEEFILLLPHTVAKDAKLICERLLQSFQKKSFYYNDKEFHLSFSGGGVEINNTSVSYPDWLERADRALYVSKNTGRKKMTIYEDKFMDHSPLQKTLRIAIIDDDSRIRTMVLDCFKNFSFDHYLIDVQAFKDGQTFFETDWHNQKGKYLIILDRNIPQMDGLQLLQKLKSKQNSKSYMVLMLTENNNEQDIIRTLILGADEYMLKPVKTKELEARVNHILKRMLF